MANTDMAEYWNGRPVDVDCAVGNRPCLQAADDHGCLIDEADVIYWGICPDCRKATGRNGGHTINNMSREGAP